jgi:dUTP pyrophosphatase
MTNPRLILHLFVAPELLDLYRDHVEAHNKSVLTDPHPNSGFDIFVPQDIEFETAFECKLINHQIKAVMYDGDENVAFALYARSSIYKLPLMLANSVGVIDAGYRGNICSAVRSLSSTPVIIQSGYRVTQLCHCSLCPFVVRLVLSECELGVSVRGECGFGSSGK